MSDATESARKGESSKDSDSPFGFKAFWKKSDKGSQAQDLKFVEQDPGIRRKKNRIGRFLKPGGTPSSQEDESGSQASGSKRRQQVYQAQKRHRNRQAEYVQNLEAEVARLQQLDAAVNSEKNTLAHQNKAIREFLSQHSIDTQFDVMNLDVSYPSSDELSQLGSAAVDFRWDADMGHERIFLDLQDIPDMIWTSSEASTEESQPGRPARHAPVAGDSWAALDFILALEWPCSGHVKHHAINPNVQIPEACAVGKFHGHALTTSQAVYQSARPISTLPIDNPTLASENTQGLHPSTSDCWVLPHSEIDKLVELAEMLELDEDFMTPAQAYSAIRGNVPNENYLRPTLQELKKPLGSLVQCHGFGAVMDSAMFWQHFDVTVQTLQIARPELGNEHG